MEREEIIKKVEKMLRKKEVLAITINDKERIIHLPNKQNLVPKILIIELSYKDKKFKFIESNGEYKIFKNGKRVELTDLEEINVIITICESNNKIYIEYGDEIEFISHKEINLRYSCNIYIEFDNYQICSLVFSSSDLTHQITKNSFLKNRKNEALSEMVKRYFEINLESWKY